MSYWGCAGGGGGQGAHGWRGKVSLSKHMSNILFVCISSDGDLPTDLLEFDTDTFAWHTATSDKTGRMVQGRHGHVALTIPCTFQANKKPKFHKLLEMP